MTYLGTHEKLEPKKLLTHEELDERSRKFGEYMERQLAGMRKWEEASLKDDGKEYASFNSI